MKLFLLPMFFCFSIYFCHSQNIDISYQNPSSIDVGGDYEIFSFEIQNNSNNIIDANSLMQIHLPFGISYDSTLSESLFISSETEDIDNPVFMYSNVIETGETVNLNFKAYANCNLYESLLNETSLVKNIIEFSYTLNDITQETIIIDDTDNYNLSFRNVHLNLPLMLNNEMNQTLLFSNLIDTVNQELVITVPGNSLDFSSFNILVDTNDYIEFIEVNGFSIDNVSYDSSLLTIEEVIDVSNILNIKFNSLDIDSNMSTFSSDIVIKLKLMYRANSCFENDSQDIKYSSYINNCILSETIGDFQFISINPKLNYSFESDNGLNLCGDSSNVTYTMTNNFDSPAAVYDIHLLLKVLDGFNISNFSINNTSIDYTYFISSDVNQIRVLGNDFPDLLGLSDEDNDGEIDDLAPGSSLIINFDVSVNSVFAFFDVNNCNNIIDETYFQIDLLSLNTICDSLYTDDSIYSFFKLRDELISIDLDFNNDFDINNPNHIQLCFDRIGSGLNNQLYDDSFLLESNIILPESLVFNQESLAIFTTDYGVILPVIKSISTINNKRILNLKVSEQYIFESSSNSYGGCFEFDLILDENVIPSNIPNILEASIIGSFTECNEKFSNLGCVANEIFLHPLLPLTCPSPSPVIPNSFNAIRTTYGKTLEGVNINLEGVENGDFLNLNTKGAYASDIIKTELVCNVICDVSSEEVLYAYVWFNHPEDIPILNLENAEFSINSGSPILINEFNLRSDLSTSIKTVYEIKITDNNFYKDDIINIYGFFRVVKQINNNPDFPDVYNIKNFRSGISIIPSLPLNPFHYGTEFTFYSLSYSASFYGNPADCSKKGDFYLSIFAIGGDNDDFPNEFRNVIQINGPIEIIIPEIISEDISIINAYYFSNNEPLEINQIDDRPGVYEIYDSSFQSSEGFKPFDKHITRMHCTIGIKLKLNNCSLTGVHNITINSSFFKQAYAEDSLIDITETNSSSLILVNGSGFQQEDLKLDIVNNYYQSVNNITRYKINIVNTTSKKALYPWIKISYPGDKISVSNSSIQGYEIIDEIYEENELLLKLMPINGNTVMEGFIDVILNDCALTNEILDIEIETGISCTDIDENILIEENKLCALDYNKKIQLEIIKSNLRMDVIPLFNDNASLAYCESFQYVIQIFNNEKANINNANFKVDVPEGFDMEIQYLYPITQTIDPNNFSFSNTNFSSQFTIQNNEYWELEDTNGVLPGYIANEGEQMFNYYQLLATFTPNCDYDGISPIEFSAKGITNCNDVKAITFQSTPKFTRLENINNYTQDLSLTIEEIQGSSSYLATINYNSNTIIEDLTGEIKINLPSGVYSTDNLNFELPQLNNTSFTFNFSVESGFCSDALFNIETSIDIDLSCNLNGSCIKSLDFQENLMVNICEQVCLIKDLEIFTTQNSNVSCLNYNLSVSTPSISNGEIILYDWKIFDVDNNLIRNFSNEEIMFDLPDYGGPFLVKLNVKGITNRGLICENETSVSITPNCYECINESKFKIEKLTDCTFKFINNSIFDSSVETEYLWDFGDGNTSSEFQPTHTYTNNSLNSVTLTVTSINENNILCESISNSIEIETNSCIQNNECIDIIDNIDFQLFPNPSNGLFNLSFNRCVKYFEVNVYNTVGKIVFNKIVANDNQVLIDISNNSKGVYIIKISNNLININKRVVIY